MSAIEIRRLVAADLAAYKSLRDEMLAAHAASFTSDPAPERPPDSYLPRLGLHHTNGGEFTLGGLRSGRIVGAVTCERDTRTKVRHIGHVIGMMVRTEAQGLGIGRALLQACIKEARAAHGLSLLTLTVTASNAAAVHLYEQAGFVRYGHLPRAILVDGVYHAKDHMALDL